MKKIFSSLLIFSIIITSVSLTSTFAIPPKPNELAIRHSDSSDSFYSEISEHDERLLSSSPTHLETPQFANATTQTNSSIPPEVKNKCDSCGIKILKYIVSSVGLATIIASFSPFKSFSRCMSDILSAFIVVKAVQLTSNTLSFIFRV